MSNDDTQAPSGSFMNSPDEYATQTTGFSSTDVKESEYHFPADGELTEKPAEVSALPPPQSNLIIHDTCTRGFDPNGDADHQPYSFQDHSGKNNSGDNVGDFSRNEPPPSDSVLPEQEGSKNGGASARYDPLDSVGIRLVGRRFKVVNPEAYHVEKDYSPTPSSSLASSDSMNYTRPNPEPYHGEKHSSPTLSSSLASSDSINYTNPVGYANQRCPSFSSVVPGNSLGPRSYSCDRSISIDCTNSDESFGELVNGRFKIVKPDAFFSDSDDD